MRKARSLARVGWSRGYCPRINRGACYSTGSQSQAQAQAPRTAVTEREREERREREDVHEEKDSQDRNKKVIELEERFRMPAYLLNIPETQVTTLPNKFRVATEYRSGETATIGVYIDAGSVWEDDNTNGVAHFLEHMAFKGTPSRTQKQIEVEIENMGGSLDAYTSREQTVYYAHVFKKDVPRAVEILSDILTKSKFETADIERERSVILREMDEVEAQHEEVVFDHLHSVAFQGTPLGYTILGPEANIKRIQRQDLVNYIEKHYTGPRMVLVGAGAVDHAELVDLGTKYFGHLPGTYNVQAPSRTVYTGSAVWMTNNMIPLVHSAVAIESVPWTSPDYFVFMLLQTLVGSWDRSLGGGPHMTSRACEVLAKEGYCHSMMSFNTCYNSTGLFGTYIVTEELLTEHAMWAVLKEWVRLALSATEMEVERAKTRLKASFLMHLDGTTPLAEDIGRQILTLGRRMSPAEVFFRIDSLTYKDVRRVAYRYIYDRDPVVAALGRVSGTTYPDYHQIKGWLWSLVS
eukprot:TRINITY_DN1309_c0_g1_i1.p1 TRINITY_DN1309_c0_g1~~TRINITY_DN1309_c0_g1_i1.p1  ORF type:complete len:521 (+),score=109.14 TRINITY_DN1309_c0_g1_i1:103-1665(+)